MAVDVAEIASEENRAMMYYNVAPISLKATTFPIIKKGITPH
jgi:hypothetical protein